MMAAFVFVFLGFLLLVFFVYRAAPRGREHEKSDDALTTIHSLDIEAFRNLVDPEEEVYLRAKLAPKEFRRIRRKRAHAALAYVKALSEASLQFARLGGAAQRSPDPEIAASGKRIANSATTLRLRVLEANLRLSLAAAFPGLGPRPVRSLLEQYDRAAQLLHSHHTLARARKQTS